MEKFLLVVLLSYISTAASKPYSDVGHVIEHKQPAVVSSNHHMAKRFVGSWDSGLSFDDSELLSKMRTKRSINEECEKLRLCKLHSRSQNNFLAAYQLYFVNKENARLWDHSAHTAANCDRKYSGCYSDTYEAKPVPARGSNRLFVQDDDYFY